MSPCRRQNTPQQSQAQETSERQSGAAAQNAAGAAAQNAAGAAAGREPAVRRYVHPIRSTRPASRCPEEALLAQIAQDLRRQSIMLEELLRRTGGNSSDTK